MVSWIGSRPDNRIAGFSFLLITSFNRQVERVGSNFVLGGLQAPRPWDDPRIGRIVNLSSAGNDGRSREYRRSSRLVSRAGVSRVAGKNLALQLSLQHVVQCGILKAGLNLNESERICFYYYLS